MYTVIHSSCVYTQPLLLLIFLPLFLFLSLPSPLFLSLLPPPPPPPSSCLSSSFLSPLSSPALPPSLVCRQMDCRVVILSEKMLPPRPLDLFSCPPNVYSGVVASKCVSRCISPSTFTSQQIERHHKLLQVSSESWFSGTSHHNLQ